MNRVTELGDEVQALGRAERDWVLHWLAAGDPDGPVAAELREAVRRARARAADWTVAEHVVHLDEIEQAVSDGKEFVKDDTGG